MMYFIAGSRFRFGKVNLVGALLFVLEGLHEDESKAIRAALRALSLLLKQGPLFLFLLSEVINCQNLIGSLPPFFIAINRKHFVASHMEIFMGPLLNKISRDHEAIDLYLHIAQRLLRGGAPLLLFCDYVPLSNQVVIN